MDDNRIFDETIQTAARALDLRSRRHELILSNLANADTPGYKAFDLMVEEAMAKQAAPQHSVQLQRTNPGHLPEGPNNLNAVRPQMVQLSGQATLRGDGNTVDMDREMTHLASNQLLYKASAQIIAKKFQALRNVIHGGK